MLITDLREQLRAGKTMDELFHYTRGQECQIYKAPEFITGDTVIYIPDISLNEIPMDRPLCNDEEIEDVLHFCYTGDNFVHECGGDVELAKRLFRYCDWQHPSAALPEIEGVADEPASEKPEALELLLPSGIKLRAKAYPEPEYPCINIDLIGEDGEPVRVCFVEHNPERSAGHQLCIGVYCSTEEDTVYYDSYDRTEDEIS